MFNIGDRVSIIEEACSDHKKNDPVIRTAGSFKGPFIIRDLQAHGGEDAWALRANGRNSMYIYKAHELKLYKISNKERVKEREAQCTG
jgi:hypothetical protein